MDLNKFLGEPIIPTLNSLKSEFPIVEYSKVEDDEFVKLPEQGFFCNLQIIQVLYLIIEYIFSLQNNILG